MQEPSAQGWSTRNATPRKKPQDPGSNSEPAPSALFHVWAVNEKSYLWSSAFLRFSFWISTCFCGWRVRSHELTIVHLRSVCSPTTREPSKNLFDLMDDEDDALSLLKKTLEEKKENEKKLAQLNGESNVERGGAEESTTNSARSVKSKGAS